MLIFPSNIMQNKKLVTLQRKSGLTGGLYLIRQCHPYMKIGKRLTSGRDVYFPPPYPPNSLQSRPCERPEPTTYCPCLISYLRYMSFGQNQNLFNGYRANRKLYLNKTKQHPHIQGLGEMAQGQECLPWPHMPGTPSTEEGRDRRSLVFPSQSV